MTRVFTLILLLFGAAFAASGERADPCCPCGTGADHADAVRITADETRKHVDHIEPLQPSGLDKNLNITGILVVEVRFGTNGKVECARATSGNPIAIAAAMQALPKWTFKPLIVGGAPQPGCGQLSIRYHLSGRKGSSTKLK